MQKLLLKAHMEKSMTLQLKAASQKRVWDLGFLTNSGYPVGSRGVYDDFWGPLSGNCCGARCFQKIAYEWKMERLERCQIVLQVCNVRAFKITMKFEVCLSYLYQDSTGNLGP